MRRIACGVFMIVLAGGALPACGDDGGDSAEEARPDRKELRAEDFETFCDAVVEYARVTLPPGTLAENPEAVDALQALVQVLSDEIDSADRTERSTLVLIRCSDDLLNILQAASGGP